MRTSMNFSDSAIVDRFLFTNMKTRRLQDSTNAHE